ncbi:Eukaryotic translation initiation factor 2 subunit beta [Zea mays]|uniref:Eukaryotic translation initiation factor 2 subunit beta n=1 Tax=Zea mays TaxID=4577 RepID=A0A1D6F4G0_MAIZE|nr:Eukaryotic translation initiation factor 2 subunit beta [Zea mays]
MADEEHPERREEASELAPFDPTKKKKKKKVVIQEPSDEVDKLAEKTESLAVAEPAELNFTGMKKKKKKQVDLDSSIDDLGDGEDTQGDQVVEEQGDGIVLGGGPTYPWEGTDRDYKYEEVIKYLLPIIFPLMHRQPEHVMMFLLAEMGTSGSLDGQQRLVIKGRFAPKNFEAILRRYINEYVICNGCKSPDTILSKENRLFFLRCEQCGSSRSVAPIKAGFVAQVGRRKA